MNRRTFLQSSALATTAALSARASTSPNEKINIAGIGIGGMGRGNLGRLATTENIVALCDVDSDYAARTFDEYPNATRYTDFRVMLEKQKDIDAVVIATPDHTHAVITKAAMEAGKHVYCQKPLTHDVYEARRIAELAKACPVITQMGIQGRSGRGAREVAEWIQAGVIGEVREVDAWCDLSYYPWGHASWSPACGERPAETPPVPDTLDWDLWIGPAPMRPYHPCYHPRSWRAWWDFGCGMMSDRGAHTFDPIIWALDLGQPTSIEANSMALSDELHPLASIVRYEFPAKGIAARGGPDVVRRPPPPAPERAEREGRAGQHGRWRACSRVPRAISPAACMARARGSFPSRGCVISRSPSRRCALSRVPTRRSGATPSETTARRMRSLAIRVSRRRSCNSGISPSA